MKVDIKTAIIIGLLVTIGLYVLGGVKPRQDRERLSAALVSARDTIRMQTITIKGLELRVFDKNAIILTMQESIQLGYVEREELRKLHLKALNSVTRLEAKIDAILDSVPTTGQVIYVPVDAVTAPAIKLPFDFAKETQYTSLTGGFDIDGNMSARVTMLAPLDIYIGLDRKSKVVESKVTSPNPDLQITSLRSVQVIVPPQRWWEKPWLGQVAAGVIGYTVGRNLR